MKRHIARLEANQGSNDVSALPSYRDRDVPPPPQETDESAGANTLRQVG